MEFRDVVRRRRMVRKYDDRPVDPAVVDRMLEHATRAPSAGFSQGWAFLRLDTPQDLGRFWRATTPEGMGDGAWMAGMSERSDIEILLPKLRLEYKRSLVDDLKALGMQQAFDPVVADFSGLFDSPQRTFISEVMHKTFVEVNEQGTTAAAATAVTVGVTSAPPSFQVDRPFIVVLRERLSGTILFVGKIVRIPGA